MLGTDFNSLSAEAQAEFKNANSQVAYLLRSIVAVELGPSPKEQLIQHVQEMVNSGMLVPKVEAERLPVIRAGN